MITFTDGVKRIETSRLPEEFKDCLLKYYVFCSMQSWSRYLHKIILFGSAARGQLKCSSDLDVCLVWQDETIQDIIRTAKQQLLQLESSMPTVDVLCCSDSAFSSRSKLIYQIIHNEGIILYEQIQMGE